MWNSGARSDERSFGNLLSLWPWPDDSLIEGLEPFQWALDGGGRHLLQTVFDAHPAALVVELGSFMGGAPRAWLSRNPRLKCICVDPWGDNLVAYVKNLVNVDWAVKSYGIDTLTRYGAILEQYGPMRVVRNNLVEFRDRCVLLRNTVPEVFDDLRRAGVKPDIVFIDAMKRREEFIGAHEAFPEAIITGDDWSWKNQADGTYPVRAAVAELAKLRNAEIYATGATFVLSEPRHGLKLDSKYRYSP